LQLKAGDVDLTGGGLSVNVADATRVRQKLAGTIAPLNWQVKDFVLDNPAITISGTGTTQNIKAICGGDVDRSFSVPAK
jgi:hypothetical protein